MKFCRLSSLAIGAIALLSSIASTASAFPHIVKPGETLAGLSTRYYGRIQLERILARANSLDGNKAPELSPGMLLEIPALTYRQVHAGESWKSLANELLGSEDRHILLAQINGHKPWVKPELGQLIKIPYNLTWVASGEESLSTLAYRFLGSTKFAYRLVQYNNLGEKGPARGDVLLLPLSDIKLTEEGRAAAETAASQISKQGQGIAYQRQRGSQSESKKLSEDIRGGRYISAVARGTELLAAGNLTQPARAGVHRQLLEAFTALDARALARESCESWRSLASEPVLDPLTTSPKILRLCESKPSATTAADNDPQKERNP